MKKILDYSKTILWAISLVLVYPFALLKYFFLIKKAKKFKKYHIEYLEEERYFKVYKLAKVIRYITRAKIQKFVDREKILAKRQLILCNHRSLLDPLLLFIFLYEQITTNFVFVAKNELLNTKIGLILNFIGTIFIDRNNIREAIKSLEIQKEKIKEGKSVVVFPEGTRNDQKQFLEFKSGCLEPAYKTMCDIQPIVLINTDQYYENKKKYKNHKQPIEIAIMDDYKAGSFISIDRVIFIKNIQKNMQKKYDEMINDEK